MAVETEGTESFEIQEVTLAQAVSILSCLNGIAVGIEDATNLVEGGKVMLNGDVQKDASMNIYPIDRITIGE